MKNYLVIGNPINHSLSPKLHNTWLKTNNINMLVINSFIFFLLIFNLYFTSQNYSTVTEYRCRYALYYPVDAFFCFTITIRCPILQMSHYTEYQYFLYETISKLRKKGMTFNQIADHLNKKKILSARGKKFRGGHFHSIMKKKSKI